MKALRLVIEGNIGSGKTWAVKHLSEKLRLEGVEEPVREWRASGALQLLYSDPKRYSYFFQCLVHMDMLDTAIANHGRPQVLERSLHSAHNVFVRHSQAVGHLCPLEVQLLNRRFQVDKGRFPQAFHVHAFIYLRTTPHIALERVRSRGRPEEASIGLHYLQAIHNLHDQWLLRRHLRHNNNNTTPVHTVDADGDYSDVAERLEKIGLLYAPCHSPPATVLMTTSN